MVEDALREYLERIEREESRQEKRRRASEILADIHARSAEDPDRYDFSTDFLYDENGLPA